MTRPSRMRGQSIPEFALILPVLLLVLLGIVDFGRGIFDYLSVSQAEGEAARVASGIGTSGVPSNATVLSAATASLPSLSLAPCPNGPISGTPAVGKAWLYISAPSPANSDSADAPGGESGTNGAGCTAPTGAVAGDQLLVTIVYNFSPVTPLIQQVTSSSITLKAASTIYVENAGGG